MTWPRATRNLKHADAGQLTAMQDAAAVLLEHERHISPDVITALCQIREETAAELKARRDISRPAHASACAPSCSLGSWSARCHAGIAADFPRRGIATRNLADTCGMWRSRHDPR